MLSDSISQLIALALRDDADPDDADDAGLTTRDTEILMLISTGMSHKHLARELSMVEGTGTLHVKPLLAKLSLRSRVEAAVWAVEHM